MPSIDIDPLAVEVIQELSDEAELDQQPQSAWEHEELAQVRIKALRGHKDVVSTCEFCDNDNKMLTASHDKTIMLWDFHSGANLHTYTGHTGQITRARMNNAGTKIASGSWDKKLHVWDAETGQILWTGVHGGIITCVNFSSDSKHIVSGSDLDFCIRVWDANTGELVNTIKDLHSSTPTSAKFNPRNDRILTTSMDKTTKFWDCKSQTCTLTLKGHVNVISDASISADERKMVTVSWDKSIAVWDISTGMFRSQGPGVIEKAHEGSISSCYLSDDGSMLVTGGYDQTVALWDTENMVQKLRLQGHTDWVEDVCYSKDQNWLMSCSKDKTVRLWNIEEGDKIPVVMENRKSIGLKMFQCASCGKPYSLTAADQLKPKDAVLCVFCRMQTPDRNVPIID